MTPRIEWDSREPFSDDVIWWSKLDGRYQIEVQSNEDNNNTATLCIFDHDNGDALVHSEKVALAYGAVFGPDIDDVMLWQDRSCEIVDSLP